MARWALSSIRGLGIHRGSYFGFRFDHFQGPRALKLGLHRGPASCTKKRSDLLPSALKGLGRALQSASGWESGTTSLAKG